MKNSILQNGNFTFETAGIKFSAVFSDALPSETGAVSIICAAENEVCVSADGKAFTVSENGVLVLSKNAEAKTERGKAAVFSVIAGKGEQEEEENLFPMFSEFFDAIEPVCLERAEDLAKLIKKGLCVSGAKEKGYATRLKAVATETIFELYYFLAALTVRISDDGEKTLAGRTRTPQTRLIFVERYLRENFQTDISLETLAEKAGVSARQLNRIFEKNYGTTFYKYLTELRIDEAKRLLSQKPMPSVEEVAYAVGYSTYTGFHNAFKKETGMLPGEYRRRKH